VDTKQQEQLAPVGLILCMNIERNSVMAWNELATIGKCIGFGLLRTVIPNCSARERVGWSPNGNGERLN